MKTYIITLLLVLSSIQLFSQNTLAGKWVFTSAALYNRPLHDSTNYKHYLIFEEDGTFSKYTIQIIPHKDTAKITAHYTYETGKWDIDRNILKTTLKEISYRNTDNGTFYSNTEFEREKFYDTITQLANDKLTLVEGLEGVTLNYERTTANPKVIFDSLPVFAKPEAVPLADVEMCCGDTLPKNLLAVYRKNPDKIKWIPNYSDVTIGLHPVTNSITKNYHESLSGTFVTTDKNMVLLNVGYTEFYGYDTSGGFISGNKNYYFASDTLICSKILLKNIDYVSYSSPFRTKVNEVSAATLFLSCLSALVVSPLVGLQKDGGFNGPKYMRWAGWSLVGVGVSLPLHIFTYPKKYKVKEF